MSVQPVITISIVSHGQGKLVGNLLLDLKSFKEAIPIEIILTLNIPEDESFIDCADGINIKVIRNLRPRGFGENHNTAASMAASSWIAILNPDLRLPADFRWGPLLSASASAGIGIVAPVVVAPDGRLEDSARKNPTLLRLARRVIFGRKPDYEIQSQVVFPDWVAGMFLFIDRARFAELQGFDERYFMYMEDADLCRRARLKGWQVLLTPEVVVIHDARRDSHQKLRSLVWHVNSVLRYLLTAKNY